ncbi:uncharacterized protein RJT20DRAFT_130068 [Scheffersomyces xylosifermentans]|uniref:uncharacterized protein n=1 Tax=Scheffersomyces xylosifermentans TaxID=1304137 RepID=UPI00315D6F03
MYCFLKSAFHITVVIGLLSVALSWLNGNELPVENDVVIEGIGEVTWNHTPQQIEDLTQELISKTVKFHDQIASLKDNVTVEDVLLEYINFENENQFLKNQLSFYQYVSTDQDVRDASTKADEVYGNRMVEESLREDLFEVFSLLSKKIDEQGIPLDSEYKLYLERLLKGFKRRGLHLSLEDREKVKQYLQQLNELSIQFSKNLNEEKGFLLFTAEELAGVPESTIDSLDVVNENDTQYYKMTFKYPDYIPVAGFAKNQTTRERAYLGYGNRNVNNNEILEQLLQVRFKLAKLVGYDSFSDYVLDERLAKNATTVSLFLDDLRTNLIPLGQKELSRLVDLNNGTEVFKWDYSYLENILLESQYEVNENEIAQYFPMDSTVAKMLNIYETLFDLEFKQETENVQAWHEDVKQFSVYKKDPVDGKKAYQGTIYFDMHPREGKYGHAANFGMAPGYLKRDNSRAHPITVLVCNFSKKTEKNPSLLKHYEVKTFFHELGHGIHDLLGHTKTASFHGTNVPRDFVEAPSQSFEFWTWEKSVLRNLTSHFETNEPLSDDLIDKLISTKHVNGALLALRQLHFGIFDLSVHNITDVNELEQLNISNLWNNLSKDITLLSTGNHTIDSYGSFGHIGGGYESAYYSYFYSEVFADDIYYTLFKEDPLNVANGRRYRDEVLSKGDSEDILTNLASLLGREPNSNAFLQEHGLEGK